MSVPFSGVMVHLQFRSLSYKPGLSLSRGRKCPTGPVKTVPQFNVIPIIQSLIYFYTATKEISWIDLLNNDNPYFKGIANQIYPPALQLIKANTTDTEAPFLDLHLSIANGFVTSKIYDICDGFHFDIVNLPFLDGDVPRYIHFSSYKVC